MDEQYQRQKELSELKKKIADNPAHAQRWAVLRSKLEVAIARNYPKLPPKLAEIMLDSLLEQSATRAAIQLGSDPELPALTNGAGWSALAKQMVENDELAMNALARQDESLKEEIRQRALASLSPFQKINMERDGSLSAYLEDAVNRELELA